MAGAETVTPRRNAGVITLSDGCTDDKISGAIFLVKPKTVTIQNVKTKSNDIKIKVGDDSIAM